MFVYNLCQPCNFVQLVIVGKGELDKAKESTAREEEFRGLVGTCKDENWRETWRN